MGKNGGEEYGFYFLEFEIVAFNKRRSQKITRPEVKMTKKMSSKNIFKGYTRYENGIDQ